MIVWEKGEREPLWPFVVLCLEGRDNVKMAGLKQVIFLEKKNTHDSVCISGCHTNKNGGTML